MSVHYQPGYGAAEENRQRKRKNFATTGIHMIIWVTETLSTLMVGIINLKIFCIFLKIFVIYKL